MFWGLYINVMCPGVADRLLLDKHGNAPAKVHGTPHVTTEVLFAGQCRR